MKIEIEMGTLEGIFLGGILAAIAFIIINLIKFGLEKAFFVFGITSLFWLVFITIVEIIKLRRKR